MRKLTPRDRLDEPGRAWRTGRAGRRPAAARSSLPLRVRQALTPSASRLATVASLSSMPRAAAASAARRTTWSNPAIRLSRLHLGAGRAEFELHPAGAPVAAGRVVGELHAVELGPADRAVARRRASATRCRSSRGWCRGAARCAGRTPRRARQTRPARPPPRCRPAPSRTARRSAPARRRRADSRRPSPRSGRCAGSCRRRLRPPPSGSSQELAGAGPAGRAVGAR